MKNKTFNERVDRIISVRSLDGSTTFSIGDKVLHVGSEEKSEPAEITGFYWEEKHAEVRANTTKGNAGIDYLYHPE